MPAARHASPVAAIALAVMATMCSCLSGPSGADTAGRLEAVELGHLDVHQDDVVVGRSEGVDSLQAVARDLGRVAHVSQQPQCELLVDRVVLGEKDPQRVSLGALGDRRRQEPSGPRRLDATAQRGRPARRTARRA